MRLALRQERRARLRRLPGSAGTFGEYVSLGSRAAADLGSGVLALNGTHDIGFLVSVVTAASLDMMRTSLH